MVAAGHFKLIRTFEFMRGFANSTNEMFAEQKSVGVILQRID